MADSSSLCAFLIYTKPPSFLVTCLVVLSPQSGQEVVGIPTSPPWAHTDFL